MKKVGSLDEAFTSIVVIGELLYGARLSTGAETNLALVASFASSITVLVAKELDVSLSKVPELRARFERARDIVDAATPADAFRRGVRYSIQDALEEGLGSPEAIERLVVQICYRAADLSVLLDSEGSALSDYSAELRVESDVSGLGGEGM